MQVRKQVEKSAKDSSKILIPQRLTETSTSTPSPDVKFSGESDTEIESSIAVDEESQRPSIDKRLKEQFHLKDDKPPRKKRRVGLCEEILISVSNFFYVCECVKIGP